MFLKINLEEQNLGFRAKQNFKYRYIHSIYMEIEGKEQLVKVVSQIGNGAHIFAPKEWIDEKVLIIRLEKKTIKEQIIEKIYPYLDKIIAVFLYGSHARNEANESSDLDVLIIAREKFKIENQKGQEFIILTAEEIPKAIESNPILMYSMAREAIAIINQDYLEKLKKLKINVNYLRKFLKQSKDSIKLSRELIELDKRTGEYSSDSVIYSAILRLRAVFIIGCILNKTLFYNSNFKIWLKNINIDYSKAYQIYQEVRAGSFGKDTSLKVEQEEKLINFLEQEIIKLEKKLD